MSVRDKMGDKVRYLPLYGSMGEEVGAGVVGVVCASGGAAGGEELNDVLDFEL
jgi:hypothetical protein